jgi:CMP-N,N'-diacetyllegionaminic acid synthase
MKKIAALILCKGNSKGVKNKNMKLFLGKPLMYWTIKSLKNSKMINKIYISSESRRILNYAEKQKIISIRRPKSLSQPKSQSEDAILHAIKVIKTNYDYIVFPQVTSPLRPKNIFDKSLKYFLKKKLDSLFSANIPSKIFLWQKNKNTIVPKYNVNKRPMRQDIKNIFLENGSFYIFKKKGFMKYKNRLFGKIGAYLIDKKHSYDIDEELDFQINKIVKKTLRNK